MKLFTQMPLLLSVVIILSFGQVLFKLAADRLPELRSIKDLFSFALEWRLILALLMYVIGTVLWIIVLKRVPLSSAYAVFALSFAITPVLAMFMLNERLNWANGLGVSFILIGIAIIVRFAPHAN